MWNKGLVSKLATPHWFELPKNPDEMPVEIKPGSEGAFNLYWFMCKMPSIEVFTEEYLSETKPLWLKAHTLSKKVVGGAEIEATATVLPPGELLIFLVKHGEEKIAQQLLTQEVL